MTDKERLHALKNEIVMAEKINEEELQPIIQENIQRYTGRFVPAYGADWDILLNEIYPIIQTQLPSIFYRNPRSFLKPRQKYYIAKKRNPISGEMESIQMDSTKSAKCQEDILNYEIGEIGYKGETQKVLLDALLYPYGIMWHGYKGNFGMTEEPNFNIKQDKVFVKRLSPMRFIHDPSCTISNLDEARWVGRIIDVPLQDLVEDDLLDVEKNLVAGYKGFGEIIGTNSINKLMQTGAQDYIKMNAARRNLIEFTDKGYQQSKYARFVHVYEIYMRPTKKEAREGKKGKVYLLTNEQEKPLRVNDWSIKAEGFPSHVLQFNDLPDSLFGLSDPETYKQIADQKNVIINLQLRNAQENSKVWVGVSKEGANEEDIEHIRRGDQSIIAFESGNPRDRMFVASAGGQASGELYLIDQRIQKNLEDKSGVSDLRRGFLQSGEESAASVKIRAAGSNIRPMYRQDIMADFLRKSLHYLNQLNKQFVPYDEAVRIMGTLDIDWSTNPSKEDVQADTDVEIDVISMLPPNPEEEIQQMQMMLNMIIGAINNPAITQKLAQEGKTFEIAPVVEHIMYRLKIKDPDIFRNIKPEESMGFTSNQQLMAAKDNANAAVSGQPIPHPPSINDDHNAHLQMYSEVAQLLQKMGHVSDTLNQLIQVQSALLQQKQENEGQAGSPVKLSKPSVRTV